MEMDAVGCYDRIVNNETPGITYGSAAAWPL